MASCSRILLLGLTCTVFLAISGCDTSNPAKPDQTLNSDRIIVTFEQPTNMWPNDPFTLMSTEVIGDTLEVLVEYSGGCVQHDFKLICYGNWMESLPVQVGILLSHDANDDNCDALIRQTLRFDLTPLRNEYNRSYPASPGIIIMVLRYGSAPDDIWKIEYRF